MESATFPAADLAGELNPSKPKNFPVDPLSSDVDTSKELQKLANARAEGKEEGKREVMQNVKSTFLISGLIVAIVATSFVVVKKLKET
ncbi:hypothetical protein H6P81_018054 [Aristolochia fimbriata]|uniref:Transmembrane protein n=1 Tax=Aristolochia fimbriata TaxID=158543 RepID=A0AAV7DZX2_ARIFI|nr:hypothetical protein H6P81_018054 [Aristolochia fimbriata]